ncbi:hypothetical protein [Streptomyces microflavus]
MNPRSVYTGPPAYGPGCVIDMPVQDSLGFRPVILAAADRPAEPGLFARAVLKVGAFVLAAGSTFGIMQAGYDALTAAGVMISAAVVAERLVDRRTRAGNKAAPAAFPPQYLGAPAAVPGTLITPAQTVSPATGNETGSAN